MTNNSLPAGTRLKSDSTTYTIETVLGSGGFGITYKATFLTRVQNLNAKVSAAIKEHFPAADCERDGATCSVTFSNTARTRVNQSKHDFISEAKCLQRLAGLHPNIINVNEVFEANNTAYYVMDYLEGTTLRQYVAENGPLSVADTIALVSPIVEAVATLHNNNFTHLDIKPANIMLTSDDGALKPVLIDFGMAKHYNDDGSATSTVQSAGFSEGYAPVEQYAGITSFSPAVDVYAIGATILFCLTGKTPPRAVEVSRQSLSSTIPPNVPRSLKNLILECMTFQASDRLPNASEVYERLKQIAAETHSPMTPAAMAPLPDAEFSDRTVASSNAFAKSSDDTVSIDNDNTVVSQPQTVPQPHVIPKPRVVSRPETGHALPPPPAPRPSTPSWVWVLIGVLLAALAAGAAYIIYSKNRPSHETEQQVHLEEATDPGRSTTASLKDDIEHRETPAEAPEPAPKLESGDVTPDLGFQFLSGPVKSCKNQWGAVLPFDREGNWTGTWHDHLGPRTFYRDPNGRIIREDYSSDKAGSGSMTYEWSGNRVVSMSDPNRQQYVSYEYNPDGSQSAQVNYLQGKTVRYDFYNVKTDRYGNWTSRSYTCTTTNDNGGSKTTSGTQRRSITYY